MSVWQRYLCQTDIPVQYTIYIYYIYNSRVGKKAILDIDKLRLNNDLPIKSSSGNKTYKRIAGKFLKGPIPLKWLEKAPPLKGKALALSICLWFLKGVSRSDTVKVSYKLLNDFKVSRESAYRGLESLEAEGLISVERHPGRSPVVTILDI